MTQNEIVQMLKVESPKTISREYLYVYVPQNYNIDIINEQQDIYNATQYILDLATAYAIGKRVRATVDEAYASGVTIVNVPLFIQSVAPLFDGVQPYYYFYYFEGAWYVNTTGEPSYDDEDVPTDPSVGGNLASIGISVDEGTVVFLVNAEEEDVAQSELGYHNNSKYYSEQAAQSATQAANSATDAAGSATQAANSATQAANSATAADESADDAANSATAAEDSASDAAGYAQDAASARNNAQTAAQNATAEALKSEGYALGTQNGASVGLQSIYFNNNSKYYSERARALTQQAQWAAEGAATSENNARTYAQQADDSADAAEGYSEDAKDARDEIIGALGNGVSVLPHPRTVPMRDANSKLYAASPTTTDDDNVVATKGFVNSSVSTNTANFLGTYTYAGTDSHSAIAAWIPSQLPAGTTVTKNDYVFVQLTVDGNTKYERYKYNSNTAAWEYEYELNNSSFTAAQWAAINSGITAGDIAAIQAALDNIAGIIEEHQEDIDSLQNTKQNVIDVNNKLSSDLVNDTNSQTHKFVTPTEKATWNGKQAALTAGRNISLAGNIADFSIPFVVLSASAGDTIDVANGTVTLSANHSAVFANNDFVRVQCNDLFGNNGDTYVFQRTDNEPAANNEKIEYFRYVDVGFYGTPLGTKAHTYIFFYTTGTTPITLGFIDREADGGGASYTAGDGIDITNNVISVDLDYYTAEEIDALWYGSYTITASVTNGTGTSGNITGKPTATATITITPSEGYTLPSTVTVTNATLVTYDDTTGAVTVTAATGNVTVTAVCESIVIYPTKGDLITMTLGNATPAAGTNNTYRVLKMNGTQAEVVAMFDQVTSQKFNPSESYGNAYSGSSLDTYLNTTWYGTLSSTAQAAIVAKSVQQYQYTYTTSVYNVATHASYADYSTKAAKGSAVSRYVYALDVEDIETYFGGRFSTANIRTLFWNTTSRPGTPTNPWLRSAVANNGIPNNAFYVYGKNGYVAYSGVGNAVYTPRPAFTIDLSKISFTINS